MFSDPMMASLIVFGGISAGMSAVNTRCQYLEDSKDIIDQTKKITRQSRRALENLNDGILKLQDEHTQLQEKLTKVQEQSIESQSKMKNSYNMLILVVVLIAAVISFLLFIKRTSMTQDFLGS